MKKLLLFLFTLLFLPMVANADASRININGIIYNLFDKDKTAEVTYSQYLQYSGEVTIPAAVTYNDSQYSVTSIGNQVFDGCSELTSVTIPNSIIYIGQYAFRDCSRLTSITIPNGVTSIESCTFAFCSRLTSVIFPNSITSIGYSAFAG